MPWDAREQRSCTSDYWQIAFLHLQVYKNAQERYRQNATGTVEYDQMTTSVQNWRQLLIAGKYGIKCSLASAPDGPCLMAGGPMLKMEFPHLKFSTLTTGNIIPVSTASTVGATMAEQFEGPQLGWMPIPFLFLQSICRYFPPLFHPFPSLEKWLYDRWGGQV